MALIPWKTKREENLERLPAPLGFHTQFDRLFDSLMADPFSWHHWPISSGAWDVPIDLEETDKEVSVRAEIPGVSADDLQLSIQGNALVISGEKKESSEKHDGGYYFQERRFGSFRREVPLPTAVDADNVRAEYKDGVLQVTLNKSQEALPKRIAVRAG
jgi:HSP20 family protein